MLCRQCGATFSQGDSFCAACGYDLGATALLAVLAQNAEKPAIEVVREALQGEYDVKSEIGRGGMGLVFRAFEKSLNREVALKVLPFAHVHDESLIERFTNEARTAAKLEHPNIVPVYRVGRAGDVIYFAMRYLTGPSLAELIVESGSLDPGDIRRILIECAQALGYAHSHGVVHRDVKPDNVMFKESGEVVVCDFGIARAATSGSLTGTGMAIGTPYYMSPEQFRARPLDGRSDIYSLGVVAYQCLTKDLPFVGEDSFAIGYKHVTEPLPTPPLKTPEHRALYDIIGRMMAKDPDDRYPDARALIDDLEVGAATDRAATSISKAITVVSARRSVSELPTVVAKPVETTPTTPLPRSAGSGGIRRPGRRHQSSSGVGVAAFAVVVLGGVGGGGYWYVQSNGGPRPAFEQAKNTIRHQLARMPFVSGWVARGDTVSQSATTPPSPAPMGLTTQATAPNDSQSVPDLRLDSLPSLAYADTVFTDSGYISRNDSISDPFGDPTGVLLLDGIGSGRVTIDSEPVFGLRHQLSPGGHQLQVNAPGYAPYSMEIIVQAGGEVRHHVQLVKTSHCNQPDENYNVLNECFDERPTLVGDQSPFVPLDETVTVTPTLPAELAIYVREDGVVGQIRITRPSDVQAFTALAIQYAKNLRFQAARHRGQNVDAWTRLQFYPQP